MVVGDAGGFVSPLSGEGLYYALDSDNNVWSWGMNDKGQLGRLLDYSNNTLSYNTVTFTPEKIKNYEKKSDVHIKTICTSPYSDTIFSIMSDHKDNSLNAIYSWGNNSWGEVLTDNSFSLLTWCDKILHTLK